MHVRKRLLSENQFLLPRPRWDSVWWLFFSLERNCKSSLSFLSRDYWSEHELGKTHLINLSLLLPTTSLTFEKLAIIDRSCSAVPSKCPLTRAIHLIIWSSLALYTEKRMIRGLKSFHWGACDGHFNKILNTINRISCVYHICKFELPCVDSCTRVCHPLTFLFLTQSDNSVVIINYQGRSRCAVITQ